MESDAVVSGPIPLTRDLGPVVHLADVPGSVELLQQPSGFLLTQNVRATSSQTFQLLDPLSPDGVPLQPVSRPISLRYSRAAASDGDGFVGVAGNLFHRFGPDGSELDATPIEFAPYADPRGIDFAGSYFVIYHDRGSLYFRGIDPSGIPLGSGGTLLGPVGGGIASSAIRCRPEGCLVAWTRDSAVQARYDILAVRIDASGFVLDPEPIEVRSVVSAAGVYDISVDPSGFMVLTSSADGVHAFRVSAMGSVTDEAHVDSNMVRIRARIDFDGTHHRVVWADYREGLMTTSVDPENVDPSPVPKQLLADRRVWDLSCRGARCFLAHGDDRFDGWLRAGPAWVAEVDSTGNVVSGSSNLVSRGRLTQRSVLGAYDGDQWLAVWIEHDGFQGEVRAARVSVDGTVLDDPPIVFGRGWQPLAVVSDGVNFHVMWSGPDSVGMVQHARVGKDGSLLDPVPRTLAEGPGVRLVGAAFGAGTLVVLIRDEQDVVWAHQLEQGCTLGPQPVSLARFGEVDIVYDGREFLLFGAASDRRTAMLLGLTASTGEVRTIERWNHPDTSYFDGRIATDSRGVSLIAYTADEWYVLTNSNRRRHRIHRYAGGIVHPHVRATWDGPLRSLTHDGISFLAAGWQDDDATLTAVVATEATQPVSEVPRLIPSMSSDPQLVHGPGGKTLLLGHPWSTERLTDAAQARFVVRAAGDGGVDSRPQHPDGGGPIDCVPVDADGGSDGGGAPVDAGEADASDAGASEADAASDGGSADAAIDTGVDVDAAPPGSDGAVLSDSGNDSSLADGGIDAAPPASDASLDTNVPDVGPTTPDGSPSADSGAGVSTGADARAVPGPAVPDPGQPADGDGCSCRAVGGGGPGSGRPFWLALAIGALLMSRRRVRGFGSTSWRIRDSSPETLRELQSRKMRWRVCSSVVRAICHCSHASSDSMSAYPRERWSASTRRSP